MAIFFIAIGTAAQDARPVLEGYHAWQDAPPADWIRANQTVHEAGGWRAYAREAAAARRRPAASGAAPATAGDPVPGGHGAMHEHAHGPAGGKL
ncbi:MAG TPA: hypothetical protein PLZ13_16370 [Ottowia sp.]|nr:hypothetical protein [Ottowia sp.]